jgi:hypothetical protein
MAAGYVVMKALAIMSARTAQILRGHGFLLKAIPSLLLNTEVRENANLCFIAQAMAQC